MPTFSVKKRWMFSHLSNHALVPASLCQRFSTFFSSKLL
jgi:hypothetical protein